MIRRIYAMILRHWFLLRGSWPRVLELIYWPTVNLLVWGFMSVYLGQMAAPDSTSTKLALAASVLIGGVLLWEVMVRTQISMALGFLEEFWSRNLGHLFVSPLSPGEWQSALMVVSFLRMLVAMIPTMLIAWIFYHFSIFSLGFSLIWFFMHLMIMGWWLSLAISALILRHGMGAEAFARIGLFIFAPVSCIYYPLTVLPGWLQSVALALPSTHVFEGMRGALANQPFSWDHFLSASGLNLLYMILAFWVFRRGFAFARRTGKLYQVGE
jgi:ABC-2 type transport system permease protein